MTPTKRSLLGLDVGEKRIGVALGITDVRLASPLVTLAVDGTEIAVLQTIIREHAITDLVVGLPRNQSGEETAQSAYVRRFAAERLVPLGLPVLFQDESVTSVLAEAQLSQHKKAFYKSDIDAAAAAIILQDYLEAQHV
jgi:putative Holliday junction resolvase